MNETRPDTTLSPEEKRALLAQLLREEAAGAAEPAAFLPSFAQQRLWFLRQLAPDSPAYNLQIAVRLSGRLDVDALGRSLSEIVRRHQTLRTSFEMVEGQPMQLVSPPAPVPLAELALQDLPRGEREARALQLARQEALRPFDLATSPLRATLLQLDRDEHILLVAVHHIVFDGWSKGIFIRELGTLYQAFSTGQLSPLPPLPAQYVDYADWQRKWLQGSVWEEQLAYWKRQLAGALPVLELATDRPRPPVQTFRAHVERFQIDLDLVHQLKLVGRQAKATLFMTLLAAFAVLLKRYSGQEDVVIGSPIAGRTRREFEALIGFFVNSLALRIDLSGDPAFLELLERVRQVALGAYAHQDTPFEQLVDSLHLERSLSHTPLFQVVFALQNVPRATLDLPGLSAQLIEMNGTAQFDLSLLMEETRSGLQGKLDYNADLFDASTMARMAEHLRNLLRGIAADPAQPISRLPLAGEAERHKLLVEWNGRDTGAGAQPPAHQLFEAQAERSPGSLAVVSQDEQVTYGELNVRANQLAHYLQSLGVGPESVVAVCMERSLELVLGLLAILKAGGAYLPLDPAYPRERLAFMMEDAQAKIVLTQANLVDSLFTSHNSQFETPPLLRIDKDWDAISQQGDSNPPCKVTAENLAYVIYTSGSTGQPKGVQIEHRGLSNLIAWHRRAFQLSPADQATQVASPAFDACTWEVWPYLAAGASLHIVPEELVVWPERLRDWLLANGITIAFLPTPLLEAMLLLEWPASSTLRTVLTGGDKLHHYPPPGLPFSLVNNYGPTENTVVTTSWLVPPQAAPAGFPPIGRPIDNVQVYILDGHLQVAPIGVPGELHIGGVGLARGYLNRPELTATKFIPCPFEEELGGSSVRGTGLYKTGDRARYTADGVIEFLGRLDDQVKIRGFRIELGEIEAVLAQHPGVKEAVVTPWNGAGAGDGQRLVAYFVAAVPAPTVSELRAFIEQKLPLYMVPAAFVSLEAWPLTPNGKVDRRALPSPGTSRPDLAASYAPPRHAPETVIAGVWAGVLGLDRVGIHDNFFELGGHSLQAVQLVSRLSMALKRSFSVKDIFLYPSVAALAESLPDRPALQVAPTSAPSPTQLGDVVGVKAETLTLEAETDLMPEQAPKTVPAASPVALDPRPLVSLFAAGKIGPVDSAALYYLIRSHFTDAEAIRDWFDDLPVCTRIMDTFLGRTALILLPCFDSDLYAGETRVIQMIVDGLRMAGHMGARVVSLTGIIPSATDYGRAISRAIGDGERLPVISTGHATTAAAVALTVKKTLQEGGRRMPQERLGVLGLGSIGTSSLYLLLRSQPHPAEILLCDLYSKLERLEEIRARLTGDLGFRGAVRVLKSELDVLPPEFYEASLIVGATNVPDVLDVARLAPGTLIVDDSGPHCFDPVLAVRRFEERRDILFSEGGVLKSPHPMKELRYVPKEIAHLPRWAELEPVFLKGLLRYNWFNITGCVLSGLLSAHMEHLKPTLGLVDVETSLEHYKTLERLSFGAANLHCGDYILDQEFLRDFRSRFGR